MKTAMLHKVLLLLLISASVTSALAIETGPEVGKLAPGFELPDTAGRKVKLSDFKGNVVLLNFWSTTCGPCKEEMPSMNSLYADLKDKGFLVLAVSIDSSEKPVRAFMSQRGLTFPVLMDKQKEVFFDSYAVMGLPTSFLIDREGVIIEKYIGPKEWNSPEIRGKISRLLTVRRQ